MAVKRPYRTSYRQIQARQRAGATRDLIAAAARRLFAQRGYERTTIVAIAKEAGVAVPTVYSNFKTKRAILAHIHELTASMSDVSELRRDFLAAPQGSRRKLEIAAAFNSRHYAHAADVYHVLGTAGESDPAIARLMRQVEDATRARVGMVAKELAAGGRLRKGVDEREAADVLFTIGSPAVFYQLVNKFGWSAHRYEEWLVDTFDRLLLSRSASD